MHFLSSKKGGIPFSPSSLYSLHYLLAEKTR